MALSKRTRFEIFKRDFFTCQYCGDRPPDVVLEVDHIDPRVLGGSDDPLNLLTSCFDCNRGKSKIPLGDKAVRPDVDAQFMEGQQELAESRRFLAMRLELDAVRERVIDKIQQHWNLTMDTQGDVPARGVIIGWLNMYSPEEIVKSIDLLLPKVRRSPFKFNRFEDYIRYISGIMRNRQEIMSA